MGHTTHLCFVEMTSASIWRLLQPIWRSNFCKEHGNICLMVNMVGNSVFTPGLDDLIGFFNLNNSMILWFQLLADYKILRLASPGTFNLPTWKIWGVKPSFLPRIFGTYNFLSAQKQMLSKTVGKRFCQEKCLPQKAMFNWKIRYLLKTHDYFVANQYQSPNLQTGLP